MGFKRLTVLFSLLLASACCWAQQLTFQVVQYDGALKEVSETSLVFEDELLNYFFDAGYVVTNEPAAPLPAGETPESFNRKLLDQAAAGGTNYSVQVNLFLDEQSETDPGVVKAADIVRTSWTVTEIASGRNVTGSGGRPKLTSGPDSDNLNVRTYAAAVAGQIRKALGMSA